MFLRRVATFLKNLFNHNVVVVNSVVNLLQLQHEQLTTQVKERLIFKLFSGRLDSYSENSIKLNITFWYEMKDI